MTYLGDFRTGKTVRFAWNSNAVAGESITRATNGTVSVYKDGGTTQSTTGVSDTEDFDSLTGVHLVAIDTSSDGTFYSAGSDFLVVLSAATIDGKTINAVLFGFSLENRSHLMPTTDGRKLDVSAGGEAGVDWANVGSPTTTLNLSGTTVKTATDVETDTQDIQSRLPAALVSGRIDASVGAMASGVLTATAIAADAITDAKVASDVTIASVTGAVGSVTGAVGSVTGAVGSVTGNVGGNVTGSVGSVATGGISATSFAAGAIDSAAIATNAIDAAALAADAITEIQSGLATAASLTTVEGKIDTIDDLLDTEVQALLSQVAQAIVDVGYIIDATDTEVAAIKAKTDNLPSDPADASDIAASFSTVNSTLATLATYVDTEVAAIKAKTDNLPSDPADASDIAAAFATVNATLATIDGRIDTEVQTLLSQVSQAIVDVGYVVDATDTEIAALTAAVAALPTANANADALLDRSAGVETNRTLRQALRIILSATAGKASISGATVIYRDTNDSKDRISATTTAAGERTAVTLDAT